MKNTLAILLFFCSLISISTFYSCTDDHSEVKRLRAQNDSLRKLLKPGEYGHYTLLPDTNTQAGALSILLDAQARNQFLTTLQMIKFDKHALESTLTHFDDNADTSKFLYLVAYPDSITGIDPDLIVSQQYISVNGTSNMCPPVCKITQ